MTDKTHCEAGCGKVQDVARIPATPGALTLERRHDQPSAGRERQITPVERLELARSTS